MIEEPIITSLLDSDWYKLTQGAVVFHSFPTARVTYKFINRGKTKFPKGFINELKRQLQYLSCVKLTMEEKNWLNTIPYMRSTFIEWFSGYQFNPDEVFIEGTDECPEISIRGLWYRCIFWEVPLMAIISELYFKMSGTKKSPNWKQRILGKANDLSDNQAFWWYSHKCHWIDFGTRRRFSFEVQKEVVNTMKSFDGFLGTSNPYLAFINKIIPHGTLAHEFVMGISGIYGVQKANGLAMKFWSDYFHGDLGVMLTDTFTTDAFLNEFTRYEACLFDGLRQDSGDPVLWGEKVLEHYRKLKISTREKRFVFSDGLDVPTCKMLNMQFQGKCQPVFGIGTNLTNDCISDYDKNNGIKPLNMVIKLSTISENNNSRVIDVVKLSDSAGKHTGTPEAIASVKYQLGIK